LLIALGDEESAAAIFHAQDAALLQLIVCAMNRPGANARFLGQRGNARKALARFPAPRANFLKQNGADLINEGGIPLSYGPAK